MNKDSGAGEPHRMKIYASFKENTPESISWLQECFSQVFHKHATDLQLRGDIQFEELCYRHYVKICVEGPRARLLKMQEAVTNFQDNQPIYRFDRTEFSQPVPIQCYHYHEVADKYGEWHTKEAPS